MDWTPLASRVDRVAREVDVAVSATIQGQAGWHYRGDDQFPAASTAKIPIMVETYRRIDRGETSLDAQYTIEATDKSPGSGVLRFLHNGLQLNVADLLYLMMASATTQRLTFSSARRAWARINETMRSLHMQGSVLGRPMLGRLAIAGEQENLATARDYTALLCSIAEHRAATPSSCAAMMTLLEKQQNGRRIGLAVPTQAGYRWGAKNGTNVGVVNEVGFIVTPRLTLLIAVYLQGVPSEMIGEAMIADIAGCALACADPAAG